MKLNIGSGPNMFPGWSNLDRVDMSGYLAMLRATTDLTGWPEAQQQMAEHCKRGDVTCQVKDLREGFAEYADGSIDAIYFGQVIEHMNVLRETVAFLGECWRMLKPGGRIRITTPDLDVLLLAYHEGRMDEFAEEQPAFYTTVPPDSQLSFLMFGAAGPECTRENYEGHFHLYGQRSMRGMLEAIGFRDVTFDRKSPVFAECVDYGMSHSMGVEAVKP